MSWSEFAFQSYTLNYKFLVVLKKIRIEKFFCGCPSCTHLLHSNWVEQHFQQLLYSHMIRSLLIEFGQARQENIWLLSRRFFLSSATKLSQ